MTLATLTRFTLALQLAGGALLGAWLLPHDRLVLVPLFALAAPFAVAGVGLAIEVIVGALVDPRSPRRSASTTVATWWHETMVSVRVFCVTQPFNAGFPEPALVRDPQRPAVLLIHGYMCNRGVWRPLLDHGTLAGCNVATVNLEPVFGSIDRYGAIVHEAIDRLRAATGAQRVTIVAHSMGGLAARVYLRDHGDAAIERVITLATPHAGTIFGTLGIGANAKQMAYGSAYLAALTAATASYTHLFVCFATHDDNLIVPRSSPLVAGTRHVMFEHVGHLALAEHGPAWAALRAELLAAPSAAAVAPASASA